LKPVKREEKASFKRFLSQLVCVGENLANISSFLPQYTVSSPPPTINIISIWIFSYCFY